VTKIEGTATRVVCGIGPRAGDLAAVDEACALAGPRGHVALVCVVDPAWPSHTAAAGAALERAMRRTRAAHVGASVYLIRSRSAAAVLLRSTADGDAVVVGAFNWPSTL
jgi:hypothetical protein